MFNPLNHHNTRLSCNLRQPPQNRMTIKFQQNLDQFQFLLVSITLSSIITASCSSATVLATFFFGVFINIFARKSKTRLYNPSIGLSEYLQNPQVFHSTQPERDIQKLNEVIRKTDYDWQQTRNISLKNEEQYQEQQKVKSSLCPLPSEPQDNYIQKENNNQYDGQYELVDTQNSSSISFGMRDGSIKDEKTIEKEDLDVVNFDPQMKGSCDLTNEYNMREMQNLCNMQLQCTSQNVEDRNTNTEYHSSNNGKINFVKRVDMEDSYLSFTNTSKSQNNTQAYIKGSQQQLTNNNNYNNLSETVNFEINTNDDQLDDPTVHNNIHLLRSTEAVDVIFGDTINDVVESTTSLTNISNDEENNDGIVMTKQSCTANVKLKDKVLCKWQKDNIYSPTALQPIDEYNEYAQLRLGSLTMGDLDVQNVQDTEAQLVDNIISTEQASTRSNKLLTPFNYENNSKNNNSLISNQSIGDLQSKNQDSIPPSLLQEMDTNINCYQQSSLRNNLIKENTPYIRETNKGQENSRSDCQAEDRFVNPVLFSDNFMICLESENLQHRKTIDVQLTANEQSKSQLQHSSQVEVSNVFLRSPTVQSVLSSTSSCSNPQTSNTDTWTLPDCQPLQQTHVMNLTQINGHKIEDLQSKAIQTRLHSIGNSNVDDVENANVVASFDMSMQFHQRIEERTQNQFQIQPDLITSYQAQCAGNCCIFMCMGQDGGRKLKSQKKTFGSWFKKGKRSNQS